MTTILRRSSTIRSMTARCAAVGLASTVCSVVTTGMVEARQQLEDMAAGLAAENSEFVLQANDVEPARVQEVRGADIFLDVAVPDLEDDRGGIVIALAVVGHRDDAGLEVRACNGYRLMQVSGEGGDTASARQRIADEGDAAERRHVWASIFCFGFSEGRANVPADVVIRSPDSCSSGMMGSGPG